jgi:phosphonate transport system permease protein
VDFHHLLLAGFTGAHSLAAVVGIVGAGGIGATLNTAISRYEYDVAAAILMIIIMIVLACEYGSSHVRRWVQ